MTKIAVIFMVLLLVGCADGGEYVSQSQIDKARRVCGAYGNALGTQQYNQCLKDKSAALGADNIADNITVTRKRNLGGYVSQSPIDKARQNCSAYGYVPGTQQFAQCVERQHGQIEAQDRCATTMSDTFSALQCTSQSNNVIGGRSKSHQECLIEIKGARGC